MIKMSQKETLSLRKKRDLLRILDCFSPFHLSCRVKELTEKTGFSRKKVWQLLKRAEDINSLAKQAIMQDKKGVYKAVYPQFDELRRALGGEEKKYSVQELLELFKERDELEFQSGKNLLWICFIPPFEDWRKEQDMLNIIRNKIYQASLKRSPNMLFRARQIFGCLIFEETEEEEKERFLRKLEPLTVKEGVSLE